LGYASIELDGTISMIFTIGFVIAVDDTIHFLSKFKLEYQRFPDISEAIRKTLHGTGKAIIITSLILFFGYLTICYSEFKVTFYHGLLVSITLLSALIADLFLIPVLLKLLLTKKKVERPSRGKLYVTNSGIYQIRNIIKTGIRSVTRFTGKLNESP